MIAFARSSSNNQCSQPAWHAGFLALLPRIHEYLRFGFRHLPVSERADAMAEAVANITIAYSRLHEQRKLHVAFASSLAEYAIRQYFAGRRVGSQLNSHDVTSPYAQRQRGFSVNSLDQRDPVGKWKEIVVEDRHTTPAEIAASRIDLEDWFAQLPRLKRDIAYALAAGESTSATARRFKVTAGRVSQLRRELQKDWLEFQSGHVAST